MDCSKERIEVLSNKSNAIILYGTLPAYCVSKVVVMESGKILFDKVHVSPRPPPTISFKDNWTKELVGFRSRWRQQRHPTNPTKTKNPIIKNGETRWWARVHKGNRERYLVWSRGREALNKNGETRMWIRIHTKLRVSHAVVKEAENFRVRELVKKIESHPHREALHADLHQNNVYNPFSTNSKAMIRELGNVELFELCETIPIVQCSQCLLYWNQGVIYCTCGQFLIDSEIHKKV